MKQFNSILIGFLLALSALVAKGQAIDQSFDSETIPYGWENDVSNVANWTVIDKDSNGPPNDHSGSGYFAFFNSRSFSQGQQGKLVTPRLDLTSGNTMLSYWLYLKRGDYGGFVTNILFVEISVDGSDTWQELRVHTKNENVNQWFNYEIDLSDYNTSDNVRIRFRAVSSGYDWEMGYCSIGLDDVTGPNVFALNHDVAIMDVSQDYIYRSNVPGKFMVEVKNWGSNTEDFDLEYQLVANPAINGSVSVTNLDPNESRAVEVPVQFDSELADQIIFSANLANDENLDGNSYEVNLTVQPTNILIIEDFSTLKGDRTPLGWNKAKGLLGDVLTYGTSNWRESTTEKVSLPQSAYISLSGYNTTANGEWLISHPTATENEGTLRISFQALVNETGLDANDFINIMYTTDDGDTWELIGTIQGDGFAKNQWDRYYFLVPEIQSAQVKFAFYAFDDISGITRNIYIDDFLVEQAPEFDFGMLSVSQDPAAMQDMVVYAHEEITIHAVAANFGTNAANVPVKWILEETGDNGSETISIDSGEKKAFTFTDKLTAPEGNGYYTLKIYTDHNDDTDNSNDAIYVRIGVYSPYSELTENFDAEKELPLGWSALTASGENSITVQTSYAKSSPNSIKMYSNGTPHNALLISPTINFEEDKMFRLRFWTNGNANGAVQVGILADPSDSTSFTPVETFIQSVAWTFQQNEVMLTNNQQASIALKYITRGVNVYLDDVSLETVVPYAVEVESIVDNKSIAQGGSVTLTAKVINTGAKNDQFNLSLNSQWDATITDENGDEISSVTLDVEESSLVYIQVTTPQEIATPIEESILLEVTSESDPNAKELAQFSVFSYKPFTAIEEGFESGTTLPQGWEAYETLNNLIRIFSSSYNANTGDNYLHLGNGDAAETSMVILPAIQEFPLYRISLYAKGSGAFEIGTVEDPYSPESFEGFSNVIKPSFSYAPLSFDLNADGGDKYIAIKAVLDGGYGTVQIDDILIEQVSEFDFETELSESAKTSFAGGVLWYNVMVENTGYSNDTYDITTDSQWSTSIYHAENDEEITSIAALSGETANFRVRIEIPTEDVTNGEEVEFNLTIASQGGSLEKTISGNAIGYNPFDEVVENFDANSSMPQFWNVFQGDASTARINTTTSNAHSPNNSLSLFRSSYSPVDPMAVTPAIQGEAQYELSYWVKGDVGATILVGTMEDPNDESTFSQISSFDVFALYTQQKVQVVTSENPVAIAFRNETLGKTIYIDDVNIFSYTTMEISPEEGSENIPTNQEIQLNFSRPVTLASGDEILSTNVSDFVTITDETANEELTFTAVVNEEKTEIVITADEAFISEHQIKVSVDNLLDINGITVSGTSSQFTIVDINPPLWIDGYPTIDELKNTQGMLKVMLNEPARVYYTLIKADETAPTIGEIFQGDAYGDVTPVKTGNELFTDEMVSVLLNDLEQNTEYSLFIAAIDMKGNEQTQSIKLDFTTLDITLPQWEEDYPVVENVGKDFVTFAVALKNNAQVSYVVVLQGETAPTIQQIIDGVDYEEVTVQAAGVVEFTDDPVKETIQGLNYDTQYELYLVAYDDEDNVQEDSVKLEFKTETNTSVGIDLINSLKIFPNPFSESIQVVSNTEITNIRIYNQWGGLVKFIPGADALQVINLRTLSTGSYIVVFELPEGKKVTKMIIKN